MSPNRDILKIIVLDDDPTGIQTVSGCLLLASWDAENIRDALCDKVDFFFILTNTRALTFEEAARRTADIMKTVLAANESLGFRMLFISRSDSTLRSHFPLEVGVMKRACELQTNVLIDGIFVAPQLFEAGRITSGNIQYVVQNGVRTPVANTEFARDSVFGYENSDLRKYIEEKSGGNIPAADVKSVTLYDLRHLSQNELTNQLLLINRGVYVIVNSEGYTDIDRFTEAFERVVRGGKRFLLHGSASVVKSLTGIPDKELLQRSDMITSTAPGVIIAGSFVSKTTNQLRQLLEDENTVGIEVDVMKIPGETEELIEDVTSQIEQTIAKKKTPVMFTSRTERTFASPEERLAFGREVSGVLVAVVQKITGKIGYLIVKGGITAADILTKGLNVDRVRVKGQILPGVPVVQTPFSCRFPTIPYVIFPGNVGKESALLDAFHILSDA
ncbi:four-carbon acid sugar kinase family protein [candidate division KSB1 bacterium]